MLNNKSPNQNFYIVNSCKNVMAVNFLAKIQLIFSNPNSFFESVKSDESTNNSIIVSFPFIVIAYGFLILTLVQKEAISSGMGMFLFFFLIFVSNLLL